MTDGSKEIRDIYRAPNGDEFHATTHAWCIEYKLPFGVWREATNHECLRMEIEGPYRVWSEK